MTYLDGKAIADEMKKELGRRLREMQDPLRLGIVMVGKNKASETFVGLKEKFARDIGCGIRRYEFEESISTNDLRARLKDIVHETRNKGIIVQLPLPLHIDTQSILNTIIPEKDVDVLSARAVGNFQVGKSKVLPPVAAAVEALFKKYGIEVRGRQAVVVGYGRLVGQPIATWLLKSGATLAVMGDEKSFDPEVLKKADIVVSGAGKPRLIKGEMVKDGVVIVDVGVSEVAGTLVGDVDAGSVAEKASFLTPQKGGVGPLTVAFIFHNLLNLQSKIDT